MHQQGLKRQRRDDDDDYEEVVPRSFLRSRVARIGNIFSHSGKRTDLV